jgi:hypothetical protein
VIIQLKGRIFENIAHNEVDPKVALDSVKRHDTSGSRTDAEHATRASQKLSAM